MINIIYIIKNFTMFHYNRYQEPSLRQLSRFLDRQTEIKPVIYLGKIQHKNTVNEKRLRYIRKNKHSNR